MTIENERTEKKPITVNKTVMEYAVQYVDERRCVKNVICLINHVRSYKKVYLLFELFGIDSRHSTTTSTEYQKSQLEWSF